MGFAHWRWGSILIHFVEGLDGILFLDGLCAVRICVFKDVVVTSHGKTSQYKVGIQIKKWLLPSKLVFTPTYPKMVRNSHVFCWGWMVVPDTFWRLAKVTQSIKKDHLEAPGGYILYLGKDHSILCFQRTLGKSCLPNEEGEEFYTCFHHVYLAKTTCGKG